MPSPPPRPRSAGPARPYPLTMKGRARSAAAAASGGLRRRRGGGGRRCRCHGDPAAGARGTAGGCTRGRRRRRTSGAAAAPPPPAAPPLGDSNPPRDPARRRRHRRCVTRPRPATGSVAMVTRSGPEGPGRGPGAALPRPGRGDPAAGTRPRPRSPGPPPPPQQPGDRALLGPGCPRVRTAARRSAAGEMSRHRAGDVSDPHFVCAGARGCARLLLHLGVTETGILRDHKGFLQDPVCACSVSFSLKQHYLLEPCPFDTVEHQFQHRTALTSKYSKSQTSNPAVFTVNVFFLPSLSDHN